MKKKILVDGMSCKHCVMHVTNALKEVAGVTKVEVSLELKSALVEGEALDEAKLAAAVADAGYSARSVVDAV